MASGLTSMILTLDEDRAFHDKFCRATIYANLCFVIKAMDAALFSRCDLWLLLLNHYMTCNSLVRYLVQRHCPRLLIDPANLN